MIILLPPSEGKHAGGEKTPESLSFSFPKPLQIAINADEKDLKCSGKRFEEGISLNVQIHTSLVVEAKYRYTGVMFSALDYSSFSEKAKKKYEKSVLICSGMYGLVRPNDLIGNYKLPIGTKGLYAYWKQQVTDALLECDDLEVLDLLPGSYKKMFDRKKITQYKTVQSPVFKKEDGSSRTHGVKKIKGKWLHDYLEGDVFLESQDIVC